MDKDICHQEVKEFAKATHIDLLHVQYVDAAIKMSRKTDKAVSWTPGTSGADGIKGADALPVWVGHSF